MPWSKIATIGSVMSIPGSIALFWAWFLLYGPKLLSRQMILPSILFLCFLAILGGTATAIFKTIYAPQELTHEPTELRVQFNTAPTLPFAIKLANVWRWYALHNDVMGFNSETKTTQLLARLWNLYINFDKPIEVRQVQVDAGGATLPQYEVKDVNQRYIIIAFSGDLTNMVVDVRILTTS